MEHCLLDLLEREKNCVTRINRTEDRIALLKAEIEHMKEAYGPSDWRDRDIASTQSRIDREVDEAAWVRESLADAREEMREYLKGMLK